ncbi:MAG: AI-2E family transporter, partial [Methanobrevibacter sp.]|nr:AI-2E family transporter [Methanobrevibacter sp.]
KYNNISIILAVVIILIPLLAILIYFLTIVGQFAYSFLIHYDVSSFSSELTSVLQEYLPSSFKNSTNSIILGVGSLINDIFKMVFDYFIDLLKSVPLISLQIFVLMASTFYFTRDGHKINKYIFAFIPESRKLFFKNMIKNIEVVLKSIFYGHFLTGLIIGIIASLGFFILGYPYALFLGILTGILQLIPIIGPWPVYFGLFISDLVSANYPRAIVVLIFGLGLSLSDMYIRPALSSKYADIHPLILLLGFLSGPLIFGITGFILGPLILGITYAIVKSYKEDQIDDLN